MSGAGSFLAGQGLAGHDPIETPSAPASNAPAGAPLFDPLTKSYPLTDDGANVEDVDPVWQEIAHRLGIPLGALSFAPELGIDINALRNVTPAQAQRTVEDVVNRALAPMIAAGTVKVIRIELAKPWSGKWDAYVVNLEDTDAGARAFGNP